MRPLDPPVILEVPTITAPDGIAAAGKVSHICFVPAAQVIGNPALLLDNIVVRASVFPDVA
jgi:hypothetical protein